MSSRSLDAVLAGIDEVKALRTHYPVSRRGIATGLEAEAAKAHGRACIVLLCSHFERYFYSINEEAIEWLNAQKCDLSRFPDDFMLLHSSRAVNELADMNWNNRAAALREFMQTHGPLWSSSAISGELQHKEILIWMKAPHPPAVDRFYRYYGISSIFKATTRHATTLAALRLSLKELVEKRNNIAHGDAQTEALPADVTKYLNAISKFTRSADRVMARAVRKMAGANQDPW